MSRPVLYFSALIVLALTIACYFTFPSYDDFVYSGMVANRGFLDTQINHYLTWGGRYSSNVFISILSIIDPTWKYYGFWSLSMVILFVASIWYMVKPLFDRPILVTLLLVSLISAAAPTITQLYYWITGAVYYSIGIFTSAVGIGVLIQRERRPGLCYDIALFILTFITVGNNEISLIGWQQLLLTYLILKKLKTNSWDKIIIALIIFGTIFGLISLLAPGNFVRQARFEKSGQVFRTVSNAILHYFLFSIKLLSPPLIILCVKFRKEIVERVAKVLSGIKEEDARKVIWAHWILFFLATFGLAFWAMGRKPNTRSMNVILFFYWISMPFIMWLFATLRKRDYPGLIKKGMDLIDRKWVPLLILSFFLTANVRNLARDYMFNFAQYRTEWVERLDVLRNGAGKDVVIYPLSIQAHTTHFDDLLARDFENLKTLFGVESVKIVTKEEFHEKN